MTAMTGQALYYLPEDGLAYKVLAIVEEEGSTPISYPLKILQSEKELVLAVTVIRHIQALLGHASLETTQIYTHLAITELQEAHRKYHPRSCQFLPLAPTSPPRPPVPEAPHNAATLHQWSLCPPVLHVSKVPFAVPPRPDSRAWRPPPH
jgi:hypothetical protein